MAQFAEKGQERSLDGPKTAPEGEVARHVRMEEEVQFRREIRRDRGQALRVDDLVDVDEQVHCWQHDLVEDAVGKKDQPGRQDEDVVEEETAEDLQAHVGPEGEEAETDGQADP